VRRKTERRDNSRLLRVVAAVVLIATLYFARVVFIPLALAFLISLLLTPPVVAFLERMKFPRIIAISLVVIAVASAMGATGWVISQQIVSLTDQLPTYKKTLEEKIHALGRGHSKGVKAASETLRDLGKEIATTVPGAKPPNDAKESQAVPGSNPSRPLAVEVVAPANPVASLENLLGPLANRRTGRAIHLAATACKFGVRPGDRRGSALHRHSKRLPLGLQRYDSSVFAVHRSAAGGLDPDWFVAGPLSRVASRPGHRRAFRRS